MDDRQSSESIKNIIEAINCEVIVLPEFQRDFVWDIGKTFDLFDSLVRNIFIGSIIYGVPTFEITIREIDRRPRKGEGSRKKLKTEFLSKEDIEKKVKAKHFRLILDGQQRVTSIYRALKGTDDVWFIAKNKNELDEQIIDQDKITLENYLYEFRGQEDKDRLSIKISDVYKMLAGEITRENKKIKLIEESLYFKKNEQIIDKNEKELLFEKFLEITDELQNVMRGDKLISYYLLNMSTEKFALFFERSNSRGIQLNFIDILAAKLYKGFNIREEIEKFESGNQDYYLNREIIVRTISYLVSKGKNVDRAYILRELDYTHFDLYWSKICFLYKSVIDFLYNNNFIISQTWIPYENMLIPIMLFLEYLPNKSFSQMTEEQFNFIKYWYWAAIFSLKYTGSTNETIIQDSGELINISCGRKITNRDFFHKMRVAITSGEDLYSLNKKGSGLYKGILNFISYAAGGTKDWNNSSKLTFNSKLNDHHIFPKEYIRKKFKNDEESLALIDCVANRTLIPKITNIKIGYKAPSLYLKEIKKNNPFIEESLKTHMIPSEKDLIDEKLYDDFFRDFVEERSKKIFDCLNTTVFGKKESVIKSHFKEMSKSSGSRKVFAKYYHNRVEATFNVDTQKILYKGKTFSVSGAANEAKQDVTGKNDAATNGWKFWKFIDDNGGDQFIEKLRVES